MTDYNLLYKSDYKPIGRIKSVSISPYTTGKSFGAEIEAEINSDDYKSLQGLLNNCYKDPMSFLFKEYDSIQLRISKVIFNPPATIVIWEDGTKTVVKCMEGDRFDEWSGLSLCICKKLLGKRFHKTFRDLIGRQT